MDKYMLNAFFFELLKLAFKHSEEAKRWGNPVAWLQEQVCLYHDRLIQRVDELPPGEGMEWRLNNAGLKLLVRKDHKRGKPIFIIAGDQVDLYPMFAAEARLIIRKCGYERRQ